MTIRHFRAAVLPALAVAAFIGVASTFASSPPQSSQAAGKPQGSMMGQRMAKGESDRERPAHEMKMDELHKRMRGMMHMRREAMKRSDADMMKKIDGVMDSMAKTIDSAFPDLLKEMDRFESKADANQKQRSDEMHKGRSDSKPMQKPERMKSMSSDPATKK